MGEKETFDQNTRFWVTFCWYFLLRFAHELVMTHVMRIATKWTILSRFSGRLIVRFYRDKIDEFARFVDFFADYCTKIAIYRDFFLISNGDPSGPSR